MGDKEATVYIIDQGRSMGKAHSGREENDLDFCLRYIWYKFTTTMEADRKTLCMGLLGLRTESTNHAFMGDESYQHISVQQPLTGGYTVAQLREAQEMVKASNTETGDAISAIVVATMMINEFTRKLKYKRKIVLVTNARGGMDGDDIDAIAEKLNEDSISLVVLGVDFDDLDYAFKEEDKNPRKADGEQLLKSLCDKCTDGTFANIAEAIDDLETPRVKEKRPYATYKGPLCLGDPDKYGEDKTMKIEVERYFKTKKASPLAASAFVKKRIIDEDTEMGGVPSTDGLAAVKRPMRYTINDDSVPGGKRDVEREDLAKGYTYGRTAVPISTSEENVTRLETKACFTIVGFVPQESHKKYLSMSESCITVAPKPSNKDQMALSTLVLAMAETESYAIARFVQKDLSDPKLLLLAPYIEPDVQGLIDVELPFQEDIRSHRFPPLDHVVTVSGAVLKTHRNLPTDDLIKSMDAYVDSMDLSAFDEDDEGNPAEYLTFEENYRPDLHRIQQVVKSRAAYPDAPIPEYPEILKKFSKPPAELVAASQKPLDKLIKVADVKKVPPKVRGRGYRKEPTKPKSGLDVTALLAKGRASTSSPNNNTTTTTTTTTDTTISLPIRTIDPTNPIPKFKQALASTTSTAEITAYVTQFSKIIKDLLDASSNFGGRNNEQVIECLRVLREEMIEFEEPELYNGVLRELKAVLVGEEEGDGDLDLWWKIRAAKLGLVDEDVSQVSEVSKEDSGAFWEVKRA